MAMQELESSPNRRNIFASKLKEINAELAELAETKTVRPSVETATDTQIESGDTFGQGFKLTLRGLLA